MEYQIDFCSSSLALAHWGGKKEGFYTVFAFTVFALRFVCMYNTSIYTVAKHMQYTILSNPIPPSDSDAWYNVMVQGRNWVIRKGGHGTSKCGWCTRKNFQVENVCGLIFLISLSSENATKSKTPQLHNW